MNIVDLEAIDLDIAFDMLERLSQENLEEAQKHIQMLLKQKFGKED